MPDYAWICHSCKGTNPPGTDACQSCAFPAVATGLKIEEAVTGVSHPPRMSRADWQAARRTDIASMPLWKKPFAYAFQLARLVGAVVVLTGIFSVSIRELALGFGIVLVAELIFQLLKGKPYPWEAS